MAFQFKLTRALTNKKLWSIPLVVFATQGLAADYSVVQMIKRNASDYAIDGNWNGADGQDVYLWSEDDSNENQQWYEIDRGDGYFSYQKANTDYCLDGNNSGENGQNVYLWSCMSTNYNQQWLKVEIDGGYYRLEKRNAPDYSLDGNKAGEDGQSVYLWDSDDGNQNQHWYFNYLSEVEVEETDDAEETNTESNVNCSDAYGLATCIDDMAAAGGGTVVLDSMTYMLSESVILESDVHIQGQGSDTVITWDNSVVSDIDEPLLTRTSGNLDNVTMSDFKMDCQVNTTDTSDQDRTSTRGVYIVGGGGQFEVDELDHTNITMERIEITRCGGEAIQVKGVNGFTGIDLDFYDNGWGYTDLWHNIYLKRGYNIVIKQTDATSGGFTESPAGHGMRLSDLDNVYMEGLTVTGNADHGIHMNDCTDTRGYNLTIEDNCADENGTCYDYRCYGDCDYDFDADQE